MNILKELHKDLSDENLREAVITEVAEQLPLPNFVEERILRVVWSYARQRLGSLIE